MKKQTKAYRGISQIYDPNHPYIGMVFFAKNRAVAKRYSGCFPNSQLLSININGMKIKDASGAWDDGLPDEAEIMVDLRKNNYDGIWMSECGAHTLALLPEAITNIKIEK